MQIYKEPEYPEYNKNSVLTVGTFDGVHSGHIKIIDRINRIRNEKKLRSVIVTFEPHPRTVIRKRDEVRILTTLDEKLELFNKLGIDIVFIINFNENFAKTSAEDFYRNYLISKISFSELVIGYNHSFGKNREGNINLLQSISDKYNFTITEIEEFRQDDEYISSTVIRKFLLNSDIEKATRLLGRYYSIQGVVIEGDKRGSILGFPTANLKLDSELKLIPGNGVYIVSVEYNSRIYYGIMNIGYRPTVSRGEKIFLEIYIFDFDENIYYRNIKVNFLDFIRKEQKFNSLKELTDQLNRDKELALNILKNKYILI